MNNITHGSLGFGTGTRMKDEWNEKKGIKSS